MTRKTNAKVIGLCHCHHGYRGIANVLGLDMAHVEARCVGLNHIIYMTDFLYKGEGPSGAPDVCDKVGAKIVGWDYGKLLPEKKVA